MSQGKTKEQAARNIRDAIESVLIVRMGQFTPETPSDERDESDSAGEETFRVKGPELTSV
jgi:predicted RNase H-like HicB family nuclease